MLPPLLPLFDQPPALPNILTRPLLSTDANGNAEAWTLAAAICPAPQCGCLNVNLTMINSATGESLPCTIEIGRRSTHAYSPEGGILVKKIVDTFTIDDWDAICLWMLMTKNEYCLRADLLPEYTKNLDPELLAHRNMGSHLGVGDFLPLMLGTPFEFAGIVYYVKDRYCLRTGCDCTEASLEFGVLGSVPLDAEFRQKEPAGEPTECLGRQPILNCRYDFKSRRLSDPTAPKYPAPCNLPKPDLDVARAFAKACDSTALAKRKKCCLEFITYVAKANSSLVQNKPKSGRNESCPCGSGLKYKRCCGK